VVASTDASLASVAWPTPEPDTTSPPRACVSLIGDADSGVCQWCVCSGLGISRRWLGIRRTPLDTTRS
jgi:hypothetical protein